MSEQFTVSSGTSVMELGYEYRTFDLSRRAFDFAARKVVEGKLPSINPMLPAWYLTSFRPDQTDFVGVKVRPSPESSDHYRVTVKIKRGHYVIAQFMRDHGAECGGVSEILTEGSSIRMRCTCEEDFDLSIEKASLPDSDPSWLD